MKRILRAALYIRVSTEEQAKEGESLPAQESALVEYANEHGYRIVDIYKDAGVSGTRKVEKRPEMMRLLEDVKQDKIDIVLFIKINRWFRSVSEYWRVQRILDDHSVMWNAITEDFKNETAMDKAMINFALTFSEYFAGVQGEHIRFTLERMAKNGEPISGNQPYGYMIIQGPKHKMIAKDLSTGDYIPDMYQKYIECHNIAETTRYLNAKYPDQKFAETYTTRRRICTRAYTGYHWARPDYYPPYVTQETFDEANAILKARAERKAHSKRTPPKLFSGLIICPCCGRRLATTYKKPTKGYPNGFRKYRCSMAWNRTGKCSYRHELYQWVIEKYCVEHAMSELKSFTLKAKTIDTEALKTEQEREKLEAQLERLNDMYLYGKMDFEYYKRHMDEVTDKLDRIKRGVKPVDRSVDELEALHIDNFESAYAALNEENRAMFWHKLLKGITVEKTHVTGLIF